ncbi:hypothetical protein [Asaia bogorensis]|uniref:hypothetical protein n=1 Tax=Asaia bogorensis TaxID=91915 RepID=UPI00301A7F96
MTQARARLLRFPAERCAAPTFDHLRAQLPADTSMADECLRYGLSAPDLNALLEQGIAIGMKMRHQIVLPADAGEAARKREIWFAPARVTMQRSITRMHDLKWRAEQTGNPQDHRAAFSARYRAWQTCKRLIAAWETLCLDEEDVRPSASILTFQKKASG